MNNQLVSTLCRVRPHLLPRYRNAMTLEVVVGVHSRECQVALVLIVLMGSLYQAMILRFGGLKPTH